MTSSFDHTELDAELTVALRRCADRLGVGFDTVVRAGQQRVHAALTGRGASLPNSWRALINDAEAVPDHTPPTVDEAVGISTGRISGYLRTAYRQLITDPDADPRRQSLLSAAETDYLLSSLSGRQRHLGSLRPHQLFERQARFRPEAVAATAGDRHLSYAELNARANRLAHHLRARGLQSEDVVAVITERTLDWLTAVLAVFKAGGVYLPIDPGFPAARIDTMISRADCRTVLTGSKIAELLAIPGPEHDLDLAIGPDQLAYLYFTSGSTGEPKGAMCEHAGMLNHLLAKIDDLEIGHESVVAQTAPQCFDISLWQLISALLVGGRTVLIDQATILDLPHFLDRLVEDRIQVLQLVPSYLDTVLTSLEQQPRPLPALRYLSVTGEAVPHQLIKRWFGLFPDVPMLNAYGLTETSDDTNHELLRYPPTDGRVPVGRPVTNVRGYVVDEFLQLVPFGAPGEIVFSGVCVGRGYINDPDRTARAFLPDPYRPGARLYRSGDLGRWRPDGKLEFHGRRDAQIKISGFRIEIGEIEHQLTSLPGIDQAAVVVHQREQPQLVAFYVGAADPVGIGDQLRRTLPHYMIPGAFHRRDRLPLTGNGKIDRHRLVDLATDLIRANPGIDLADRPRTATEQRVAAAWAAVLGIDPSGIGRQDDFFDRGGTSLSAVKLAVALHRRVSIKDISRHPRLADLAALLATDSVTIDQ